MGTTSWLTIKNWDTFQHYKDRNPPWIKLHRALLDDYAFAALPDHQKAHLVLIWLFAASQAGGRIPNDAAFLSRKLGTTEAINLENLVNAGFLLLEQDASNVLAERKQDACIPLALARSRESESEAESEVPASDDAGCCQPAADHSPSCPHQEIIKLYGKHLPTLPQPRIWEGQRTDSLKARWRWVLTAKNPKGERYATDAASALAFFDRFFGYVAASEFLTGRDGKWSGCDLAWLVKAANFAKVIEGKYENREAA